MALGGLSLKLAQRHMIHKAIVIAMLATASLQGSMIYDFAGTGVSGGTSEPVAFQPTVPNFVNPPAGRSAVAFSCTQLDLSTNCGIGVFFLTQPAEV